MMAEKTGLKPLKMNFLAFVSIVTCFLLCYHVRDIDANPAVIPMQNVLKKESTKKNIIMMVTDGTGPSSINMARSYRQFVEDLEYNDVLTLDKYLIGQSRTLSSSSLITDSAAGATAFSCGLKSYNGAIGVDSKRNPCGTILEALKLKGYKTGLVVTTSLVDATPASFTSHANFRNMLDLIANQQLGLNHTLGNVVDLMIGGGRCSFLPNTEEGSCRSDDVDLVQFAREKGWEVSLNKEEFDQLELGLNDDVQLPILSLLAYYNIPYEIDRDENTHPSLYEETVTALNLLSKATKDTDEGFFLMIEGSRIDHAGHHNDAHAQVREVLAYDKAFQEVIKFAEAFDVETYVISTSDHETGGLDIGRQVGKDYPQYVWYPEVLANAKHSGEYLNVKLNQWLKGKYEDNHISHKKLKDYLVDEIITKDLGIEDCSDNEVDELIKLIFTTGEEFTAFDDDVVGAKEVEAGSDVIEYLKDMVNRRALIGWSTHGHTSADVNIYGYCNTEECHHKLLKNLGGSRENTDIGKFMEYVTGVSLDDVTSQLLEKGQIHE